jgi:hypothetical protein
MFDGVFNPSKRLAPEELYRRLGRLIEAMPEIGHIPLQDSTRKWIADAYALVRECDDKAEAFAFKLAVDGLGTLAWADNVEKIKSIVYRALAVSELKAPPGIGGSFIPVGNGFDAFAALSKVLRSAVKDVLIVDPYMDETALTDFGICLQEGIALRLLADEEDHKATLKPATKKWMQQYSGTRPLEVKLAPPKALHDRAILIDGTVAWTLTQSLKDFAKRAPAEIVRADEIAPLKIAAYEKVWLTAKAIL